MLKSTAPIALVLLACLATPATATQPNIVFVIGDDCTYRDIETYGGQAKTPNINRLAAQGMRFTRSFEAAPMCSPTRHNIYTGLYPVKSGAYPNHTFVKDGTKSVVQYLRPLGYRVALSGKTHINPKSIFDFEYSTKDNNPDMQAIDKLMSECKANGNPFALFACSNEPHGPWDKGDPSQYPPVSLKLPPYFVDTLETRDGYSKYLAEITYLDSQVGQLMDLLDKHGLADNTLFIFTSEQGASFPFGKWTCYDTGLQNALVVRWPGKIKPGSIANAMVEYVDLLPTFIEAAGGWPVKGLDGKSFVPVLTGRTDHHKDFVYGIQTTRGINSGSDFYGIRSVRSERYKLIVNLTPEAIFKNGLTRGSMFQSWRDAAKTDPDAADKVHRYQHRPPIEFYDIVSDPYEWNNLAEDPKYTAEIAKLRVQLDAWMRDQGDLGQQTELDAYERQGMSRRAKNNKR
ncbi:MAG: sulfatase family protein [Planctomycetota bacterium]|jgi:uncharacterized sulfatase